MSGGTVTAKSSGNANISVTTGDGNKTDRCTVTVTEPIESVSVDGTQKVGNTLTANITPDSATATYQWQESNAIEGQYSNIENATGKTYQVSGDKIGKYIKVKVTGTGNYTGSKVSRATEVIKQDVQSVEISGTATVGQTLTAHATPPDSTVTYEWLQCDTHGGTFENISGANEKTYTLKQTEQGKFIKVKVTGTDNYTGAQTSAATSAVSAAETANEKLVKSI